MTKRSLTRGFLHNRQLKLITSPVLGIAVFFTFRASSSVIVSFMVGWLAFAIFNLTFSWVIIFSDHPKEVKAFAAKEDTSAPFIFLFVLAAAFISLFAIIFLLQSIPDESKNKLSVHILLSFSSVFCSWLLVHTLFTLRYAHLYYSNNATDTTAISRDSSGLDFPSETEPDYLDFAYFSFVIGMTFQVSDVEIKSRTIRRHVLVHSLLSFIYNTVIVAFSINIISGLISK